MNLRTATIMFLSCCAIQLLRTEHALHSQMAQYDIYHITYSNVVVILNEKSFG